VRPGRSPRFHLAVGSAAFLTLLALLGAAAPGRDAGDSTAAENQAPAGALAAGAADTLEADDSGFGTGVARVPWHIGEYFQFSVSWSGINAGSALMQVQNWQWVDGHKTWRIISKTESNSFVSKFYKVRDRVETSIDAESLYSRRFEKHLREGGYKHDSAVRFDQENQKARYEDGKVVEVPPRVHDVLSAFYYVRTQPLPDGATFSIPAHDNQKSYDLEVHVLRRERIEVPAGKFDCVVVEPVLKSEGIFKSKGQLLVWLTDDDRRLPVKVTSKVPIGSISVSLVEYRLAFERKS
jgi:Protein of unknown function (DUF3108)